MSTHDFATMRRAMVDSQLRTSDVNDPRVVAAMAAVPRERFVPAPRAPVAYADRSIPLGHGRAIAPPLTLGQMLQATLPAATARALVIGAGTGYAAAVLARLAGTVFALEEDAGLLAAARTNLAGGDIVVAEGTLAEGLEASAPYDLILIDGAVEQIPDAIVAQLAPGGAIVTGLIRDGVTRIAVGRGPVGGFGLAAIADAEVPALPQFARPRAFQF